QPALREKVELGGRISAGTVALRSLFGEALSDIDGNRQGLEVVLDDVRRLGGTRDARNAVRAVIRRLASFSECDGHEYPHVLVRSFESGGRPRRCGNDR